MKISKVRRTDYRPPTAGNPPPLERHARPGAVAWEGYSSKDTADHDKTVKPLSDTTLLAAARDLGQRRANRGNPEGRWILDRLVALAREIDHRKLNQKSA